MTEKLYNKIDKFCNGTDWSKYPTYEHALEDFIKGIVAEETDELEKEKAELVQEKYNLEYKIENLENKIEHHQEVIDTFKKKNAELKKERQCECIRCVYSDSPCIRSDYGVENDEDVCPNYENVFVAYTQLKEENAELKRSCDETQELLDKQIEATLKLDINLSKAKELIKKLKALYFSPVVTKDDVKRQDEILSEVEQFLSEVEK